MVLVGVDRHVRINGLVIYKDIAYLQILPTPILVNMKSYFIRKLIQTYLPILKYTLSVKCYSVI